MVFRSVGLAFVAALCLGCSSKEQEASPPASPSGAAQEPTPAPPSETEPEEAQPPAAVVVPEATEAHRAVQTTMRGEPLADAPLVHFTAVEDATGEALAHFHSALRKLKAGKDPDGKVRVAVWGASSTSADRFTAYLRGYLQHRFGDAGAGFVTLVPLWKWHRHNAVRVKASKHWMIEHGQKKTGRLDGHYGLIGASATTTNKRAWAELATKKTKANTNAALSNIVELYWLASPDGGSFDVKLGGERVATVKTKAEAAAAGYTLLESPQERFPLRIEPKGDGEARLFGAVLERDTTGVVVDELGIGGTRAANLLNWSDGPWQDHVARRPPDLVMLAYGANESMDVDEPIEVYRESLEKVLAKLAAAAPEASCVLIGPQDFPMKDEEDNRILRPRLEQILQTQRAVAAKRGCGFFDTRAMMGGIGSMVSWVEAEPKLGKGDHLHFTPLGYVHLGRVLSDAVMARYDAP